MGEGGWLGVAAVNQQPLDFNPQLWKPGITPGFAIDESHVLASIACTAYDLYFKVIPSNRSTIFTIFALLPVFMMF